LKPGRWRSPLVQEKYQKEKACDKRHPNNNNNKYSNNKYNRFNTASNDISTINRNNRIAATPCSLGT